MRVSPGPGTKSTLATEFRQQPQALRALLRHIAGGRSLRSQFAALDLQRMESILFLGMGSSLYGALPALYALAARGVRARACEASEYLHYSAPFEHAAPHEAAVLISQSGRSPEILKLAAILKGEKRHFVAVTNDEESPLAQDSRSVLLLHAGQELGPSTKSYTNTVAACMMLAASARPDGFRSTLALLRHAAEAMRRTQLLKKMSTKIAEALASSSNIDILGRGPALATAYQASLLLREVAGLRTNATSAGLFRHGPMYATSRHDVVFLLSPAGPTHSRMLRLALELAEREANVLLLTDVSGLKLKGVHILELPHLDQWLFPLTSIVPFVSSGLELCRQLNRNPGQGVSKVTTTE